MSNTVTLQLVIERGGKDSETLDVGNPGAELRTGYKCLECEAVSEETAEARLYECGECGNIFNANAGGGPSGNRCEECGKFASKLADDCCAECETGEIEAIDVTDCPICGALIAVDDLVGHIENGCCD